MEVGEGGGGGEVETNCAYKGTGRGRRMEG